MVELIAREQATLQQDPSKARSCEYKSSRRGAPRGIAAKVREHPASPSAVANRTKF